MLAPDSEATPSFEAALGRLEEIVRMLEDGNMPLEQALEVFEEGIRLSRFCHAKLQEAERRVEILLENADGEIVPQRFDPGPARSPETER
jgi:exodeoxyribonuclease VII small subunit